MWSEKVHEKVKNRKLRWPTGAPFDRILDWFDAWNKLHYRPRTSKPRTYNELILSNKYRLWSRMALARRVTDKIGFKDWLDETPERRELIVPTMEVFYSTTKLRRKLIKEDMVLKPAHLGGPMLIFDRARRLTREELEEAESWFERDYYRESREPCYKGIEKRLILEPLVRDSTGGIAKIYKFHMVKGNCLMIQVDSDHSSQTQTRQLYSPEWDLLDYSMQYPKKSKPIRRPTQLDEALNIATRMARLFPLCRVDLYIYSEGAKKTAAIKADGITIFPGSGYEPFNPPEADWEFGRRAQALMAG